MHKDNYIPPHFVDRQAYIWLLFAPAAKKQWRRFDPGEDPATSKKFHAFTTDEAAAAYAESQPPTPPVWLTDGIDADASRITDEDTSANDKSSNTIETGMFRTRPANEVLQQAALQPDPVELYPYLVVEGELTILFADTGIGKTVYAVQIGIAIAVIKVLLYVDLELSDKQFEKRYKSKEGVHYTFPPNFYRADFTPRFTPPIGISYEDYFIQSLQQAIDAVGAEVVIIDNMTKLSSGDTDSAKAAIPVMDSLSRLKFDNGITFIILEHNKKVDTTRPISLNDLQGSKMKANFADAIFSIGRSQTDKNLRYVKQLKVRSAEQVFDTENVATYELTPEGNYLHFEPIGFGNEFDFLRLPSDNEKPDIKADRYQQIQELRRQGIAGSELARRMGMSKSRICKIEKEYASKSDDKSTVSSQFPTGNSK